jgi:hypothetical protein
MKKALKLLLITFLICIPVFANINKIDSSYSSQMQKAQSSSEMDNYTLNSSNSLKSEIKEISLLLNKNLSPEQKEILAKNTEAWNKYTNNLHNSTIKILHQQKGTIYQNFATASVYAQHYTRALTLYYLTKKSQYEQHDYLSKDLKTCLETATSNIMTCECYHKETEKYKSKISKELALAKTNLSNEEFNDVMLAQSSWEEYLNHTQISLFKIFDRQKSPDKDLKKAEIIFRLYQNRFSEIANINF